MSDAAARARELVDDLIAVHCIEQTGPKRERAAQILTRALTDAEQRAEGWRQDEESIHVICDAAMIDTDRSWSVGERVKLLAELLQEAKAVIGEVAQRAEQAEQRAQRAEESLRFWDEQYRKAGQSLERHLADARRALVAAEALTAQMVTCLDCEESAKDRHHDCLLRAMALGESLRAALATPSPGGAEGQE